MSKKIAAICGKLLVLLVGIVLFDLLMSYMLIPAHGTYAQMWKNYEVKENIDTVFVGNSVCGVGFLAREVDKAAGTTSVNMGTDGQDLNQSFLAIKTAVREHDIKTVVLGMEYITLQEANTGAVTVAFQVGRNQATKGLPGKALGMWDYMSCDYWINRTESINVLFPWTSYHVSPHIPEILSNTKTKLSGFRIEANDEIASDVVNTENLHADTLFDESINNRDVYGYVELNDTCLAMLKDIAKYCNRHDIDFIVVNMPRPSYDIKMYGEEYFDNKAQLEALQTAWGFSYYDFNFVSEELFDTENKEYYFDFEHLNAVGAKAFSESFGKFLLLREEGKDVTTLFKEI